MSDWVIDVQYPGVPCPEDRRRTDVEIDEPGAEIASMTVCGPSYTEVSIVVQAETEAAAREAGVRVAARLARSLRLPETPTWVTVLPLDVARARWLDEMVAARAE